MPGGAERSRGVGTWPGWRARDVQSRAELRWASVAGRGGRETDAEREEDEEVVRCEGEEVPAQQVEGGKLEREGARHIEAVVDVDDWYK